MGDKPEITVVTAYKFAGTLFLEREDAERALARQNLYEFVKKELGATTNGLDLVCENLEKNFEKYSTLLNAFY